MPILIDSDSELMSSDDDVIYERTVIRHIETSNTGLNQSVTCQQRSILRSCRCRISESSGSSSDQQFADIKNSFANDIKEETLD
uniref:U-box domain-containing protein n=1 Tax=Heterorhabditis bacteriophora TaxID=37862 RepID=A0A1I7XBV0_HETBA